MRYNQKIILRRENPQELKDMVIYMREKKIQILFYIVAMFQFFLQKTRESQGTEDLVKRRRGLVGKLKNANTVFS